MPNLTYCGLFAYNVRDIQFPIETFRWIANDLMFGYGEAPGQVVWTAAFPDLSHLSALPTPRTHSAGSQRHRLLACHGLLRSDHTVVASFIIAISSPVTYVAGAVDMW